MSKAGSGNLMQSFYLYSAVLALKLISLAPLASLMCPDNSYKAQRAFVNDLKVISPFWLVSGLYMTTSPDSALALALLRAFVAARFVTFIGYIYNDVPKVAKELSFFVSIVVTGFMGTAVVYHYRKAM